MSTITTNSHPKTLKSHLEAELGVKVPDGATTAVQLIELIRSNGGTVIEADKDTAGGGAKGDDSAQNKKKADIDALCKTKVRMVLNDRKDAEKQHTLGVNGVFTTITRGEEVTVPYPVYHALLIAKTTVYEQKGNEMVEKEIATEPLSVIKFDVQPGEYED